MNAIEHAVALPPDEVVVHRATRRKILRNIAPLTTGAQDVHQAVHHRTHVGAALAAARPRRRNERRNNRPLLVREVAWVPQMITIVSRSVFLRPHRQPPANQTASFQSQMIPATPEVSRRTLRISRSWSPVTMQSARPRTAVSNSLSSSGSRQVFTPPCNSTKTAARARSATNVRRLDASRYLLNFERASRVSTSWSSSRCDKRRILENPTEAGEWFSEGRQNRTDQHIGVDDDPLNSHRR